jgi:Ras-related protein Rab-11A
MTQNNSNQKFDFVYKIVMIGDHGVGKTQLVIRYTKNDFDAHSKTTIGVEFTTKSHTIDGKSIGAQIWDTAGEEKYKSLTSIYYKGAVGALLVYDITRRSTFERICNQWMNELKNYSDPNIITILIGNKCDLKERQEVTTEEAETFARNNGIAYMEASAKSAMNVQVAFEKVLEEIYRIGTKNSVQSTRAPSPDCTKTEVNSGTNITNNTGKVTLSKKAPKKKKGCC